MKSILQKDLWSITSFLENKEYNFNKEEKFDKKSSVTHWEKNSTLDC